MDRRSYLTAVCTAGIAATAGCSALGREQRLSQPTVDSGSGGRRTLVFSADGERVGSFGVNGHVEDSRIELSTQIWHEEGTEVESIQLRVWMPEAAIPAEVAVVSPIEEDSSPPPSISLYTPERPPGTMIGITDLDDLADETISTLDLRVKPRGGSATTVTIQATIELADSGLLSNDYTLDGELHLEYPALADQQDG